jgi:hypothetical protein
VGPVNPNLVCMIKPMVVPHSRCRSGQVAWRRRRLDSGRILELVDVLHAIHTRSWHASNE